MPPQQFGKRRLLAAIEKRIEQLPVIASIRLAREAMNPGHSASGIGRHEQTASVRSGKRQRDTSAKRFSASLILIGRAGSVRHRWNRGLCTKTRTWNDAKKNIRKAGKQERQ